MYICATIGPQVGDKQSLEKLMQAGANTFRLNFSWGTHEEYVQIIKDIREVAAENKLQVYILQDLQGPKLRVSNLTQTVNLKPEQEIQFAYDNPSLPNLKAKGLYKQENIGQFILIKDGSIRLQIIDVKDNTITCKALSTGSFKNRNGANAPGINLELEPLSSKDKADLEFGLKHNLDMISLSFIHNEQDIIQLKNILAGQAKVVAKIETQAAVNQIEDILKHADLCMIARGDLGVELGLENLPQAQELIQKTGVKLNVPVLIATEVLKTMLENKTPSRAECNDIYESIMDGAKGFILTNETVIGQNPFIAIKTLKELCDSYSQQK